jgi:hypothetical protein
MAGVCGPLTRFRNSPFWHLVGPDARLSCFGLVAIGVPCMLILPFLILPYRNVLLAPTFYTTTPVQYCHLVCDGCNEVGNTTAPYCPSLIATNTSGSCGNGFSCCGDGSDCSSSVTNLACRNACSTGVAINFGVQLLGSAFNLSNYCLDNGTLYTSDGSGSQCKDVFIGAGNITQEPNEIVISYVQGISDPVRLIELGLASDSYFLEDGYYTILLVVLILYGLGVGSLECVCCVSLWVRSCGYCVRQQRARARQRASAELRIRGWLTAKIARDRIQRERSWKHRVAIVNYYTVARRRLYERQERGPLLPDTTFNPLATLRPSSARINYSVSTEPSSARASRLSPLEIATDVNSVRRRDV